MISAGSIAVIISLFSAFYLKGQSAKEDYATLGKELQVRELSTLMFAKYNDVNINKIEVFSKNTPKSMNEKRYCAGSQSLRKRNCRPSQTLA